MRILTAILFLLLTLSCSAELFYVYLDDIGVVEDPKGHTEKGDVVAICAYTPQYKPTRAEFQRYKIVVAELTQEQIEDYLKPLEKNGVKVKERSKKVKLEALNIYKQEEEIDEIDKDFITKPLL